MPDWAVPVGALIISAATLIYTALQSNKMARKSYVEDLEDQVKRLRDDLRQCNKSRIDLEKKNFQLMSEMIDLERRLKLLEKELRESSAA